LTTSDIVVSKTPPTSPFAGLIWIKPVDSSSGGGSGDSGDPEEFSSVEVVYSATCSELGWTSRNYIGTNYNSKSLSGTLYGSGQSTALSNCSYTVQIPLNLGSSTTQKTNILCRLTGTNGSSIELSGSVSGTGEKLVVLTKTTSTWIGSGGSVSFTICTDGTGTYSNVLNSRASSALFKVDCVATS